MRQVTIRCPMCPLYARPGCPTCNGTGTRQRWEPTWSDRIGEWTGTVLILGAAGVALVGGTALWVFAAFHG